MTEKNRASDPFVVKWQAYKQCGCNVCNVLSWKCLHSRPCRAAVLWFLWLFR